MKRLITKVLELEESMNRAEAQWAAAWEEKGGALPLEGAAAARLEEWDTAHAAYVAAREEWAATLTDPSA